MSTAQKLFAVCLVASAVAYVAGQSFNPMSCSSKASKHITDYMQSMIQASQKFTNSMQSNGAQAADISDIQSDIEKMAQSMSSFTDASQGFSMDRFTNAYMENFSTMTSIMRKSFRVNLLTGSMDSYLELSTSMVSSYTRVMQQVANSCMNSKRSQLRVD